MFLDIGSLFMIQNRISHCWACQNFLISEKRPNFTDGVYNVDVDGNQVFWIQVKSKQNKIFKDYVFLPEFLELDIA